MAKPDSRPTIIDLFSGVGGLSLGAARAGFRVAASVELDPIASKSHQDNFPTTAHLEQDVSVLCGADLLAAAKLERGQLSGLIGGPPCQGFSFIGRRQEEDARNQLFGSFFRLVAETRPAFYLAENVPGILTERYANFVERSMDALPKSYVRLPPFKVQANEYGAPTTRKRVFFIGYDPELVNSINPDDFEPKNIEQVLVGDALYGLSPVRAHWQSEKDGWREVREMPSTQFSNRVMNAVPRGVGDSHAINMLRKHNKASGFLGTIHSIDTIKRFEKLKPGEVDSVYRSPRLDRKGFCPTLRAGTGRDRGSYQAVRPIHPTSPRVITPREAARLQGFPDWFVFNPTKWHSFRQIGNSVSPIVAEILLSKLSKACKK